MLGGHLVMSLFSTICMLQCTYFLHTNSIHASPNAKVQKGCNDAADTCTCISELFTYPNNLQTEGVQITENALYMF